MYDSVYDKKQKKLNLFVTSKQCVQIATIVLFIKNISFHRLCCLCQSECIFKISQAEHYFEYEQNKWRKELWCFVILFLSYRATAFSWLPIERSNTSL